MADKIKQNPWNTEVEVKLEKWLNLTPEEKKELEKYLKSKEKKEIIAFTKEELETFRKLLNNRPNSEEELRKFVEAQEKETVTASEIMERSTVIEKMWGIEKFRDISDIIDWTLYKHFFENSDSVFATLNISEDAKRNFTTWANFFFINYISKELEKSNSTEELEKIVWDLFWDEKKEGFLESLKSIEDLTKNIWNIFELWKNLFTGDLAKTLKKVYNPEKENILKEVFWELKIKDYEQEAIFMNPLEAHNFMEFVYNKNHSKEEIKAYIKERRKNSKVEFSEWDKNKLKEIWEKVGNILPEGVFKGLWKLNDFKKDLTKVWEWIKNAIVENKEVAWILSLLTAIPVLWDFIKSILEFIWIKDLDKLLAWKNFEASKKIISENIVWKESIFEKKKIPVDFMQINWNNDNTFLNDINFLIWETEEKDFGKNISKLFKKWWEFEKFIEKSNIKVLDWENINYKKLKEVVSSFREFKFEKEKNKEITIKEFIEKKEKDKKELEQKLAKQEEDKKTLESLNNSNTSLKEKQLAEKKAQEEIKKSEKQAKQLRKEWKATEAKNLEAEARKKAEEAKKAREQAEKEAAEAEAKAKILKEKYTINEDEKLEISNLLVEPVLEAHWKKYKISLTKDSFSIIWDWNIVNYKWWEEIFNVLSWYNWRLNEKATWWDFWKTGVEASIELNNYTIKDILLNGINEKVWFNTPLWKIWKEINEKWLKQHFTENFFENWKLKDKVTMKFWKKYYTFEKA